MRFNIKMLALPLLMVACKKSGETEAPAEQAPPPPPKADLVWTWSGAAYSGEKADDSVGTITYTASIANQTSDKGLVVRNWSVGMRGDDGRLCVSKGDEIKKTSSGGTLALELTGDCRYGQLPDGDMVTLSGYVEYTLGDAPMKADISEKVKLTR